ncbi:MAG TPA: DNA repair protein RecN [Methylocella sp.]|nr:DNA repair protein RecN [Methylocella sp.]
MLVSLAIRDIVLIDQLDLEFSSGLTILTGETGAGKSILLDAFALALGARGDGGLVRHGEPQGQVTAAFELATDHPALVQAKAQEIETDGSLILRRIQLADGRSRAFINDQRVTTQALRAIAQELVEIHGQHDDRALVDCGTHRGLLDAFGGLAAETEKVRAAFARRRDLKAEYQRELQRVEKARTEADYLRHAASELEGLAAQPDEEQALAERRILMMQAEKVSGELRDAQASVTGDGSALPVLAAALRRLERRQAQAPHLIAPVAEALDAALTALDGAGRALDQALREAEFDPKELERAEERLFALRAAGRKYSVSVDQLPVTLASFVEELACLDADEVRVKELAKEVEGAERTYRAAAAALSEARQHAARKLDAAVNAELRPLKLEGAVFSAQVQAGMEGAEGRDEVEFWVQTNPGTKPGPLMKIASGGELARFMLALKVVLAGRGSAPTLVFDEIDTGAGGAVADAIGQRLARLASRVQVLAVTHAPQVAARAGSHFRIAKGAADKGRRMATAVAKLEDPARREEIARMLAGATITEEARAAAASLLAGGFEPRPPQGSEKPARPKAARSSKVGS